MRTVDLIQRKRDGDELAPEEIEFLVDGYTTGEIPDYQMSAFLMATYFSGMSDREVSRLTECMLRSGETVDLSSVPGVKVDKHSTGGVGDKTSLIVAPLAAAAGVVVPMMSGRGLGHTGGTLDKLESIPGFRTNLTLPELRAAIQKVRCALIGQTSEVAPADRRLYALRDVTGTVESIPLISASIMSKKIAEGIGALVLDVMVLGAMIARIGDLGFTPNRTAALGLNLVLLVNLAGAAWLSARFLTGRSRLHQLERWQTSYLPVFALWTAAVVVVLPPLFAFS